jgi:hypothetical protein
MFILHDPHTHSLSRSSSPRQRSVCASPERHQSDLLSTRNCCAARATSLHHCASLSRTASLTQQHVCTVRSANLYICWALFVIDYSSFCTRTHQQSTDRFDAHLCIRLRGAPRAQMFGAFNNSRGQVVLNLGLADSARYYSVTAPQMLLLHVYATDALWRLMLQLHPVTPLTR